MAPAIVLALVLPLLFQPAPRPQDGAGVGATTQPRPPIRDSSESVALLYIDTPTASQIFDCTATCIKSAGLFSAGQWLTAGHCVLSDDPKNPGNQRITPGQFSLLKDEPGDTKHYVNAKVTRFGDKDAGFDYAILESNLGAPAIELGDESTLVTGTEVSTYSGAGGAGIGLIRGYVSIPSMRRTDENPSEHHNWTGAILIDLSMWFGGSGSPVLANGKIVGVVVGMNMPYTVAIPISRIRRDMLRPWEPEKKDKKEK